MGRRRPRCTRTDTRVTYTTWLRSTVAVMADARDLQKSGGNGDGAWFATQDGDGRGRARDDDGQVVAVGAAEPTDGVMVETAQFVPTVYLYDNFPGGVGLSEPLWQRQGELVQRARELVAEIGRAHV